VHGDGHNSFQDSEKSSSLQYWKAGLFDKSVLDYEIPYGRLNKHEKYQKYEKVKFYNPMDPGEIPHDF